MYSFQKVNRYQRFFLFGILIFGFIILSSNIGRFLDVTQTPQKSDIIVCLGGGGIERLTKVIDLYKKGYSRQNKILLTGTLIGKLSSQDKHGFWKIPFLKKHEINEENIFFLPKTHNTYQELKQIKHYMLQHKFHSVLIVSDPPHARRIQYLVDYLNFRDNNLSYIIVGSQVHWWDRNTFYKYRIGFQEAFKEMIKLIASVIIFI